MKSPCEMIVWKVLPAVRARLAEELSKGGLSQREVAKKLGITEAAVSQYVNKRRAFDFKIDSALNNSFTESAKKLSKSTSNMDAITESCKICREIRKGGFLCAVHLANTDLPKTCNICVSKQ